MKSISLCVKVVDVTGGRMSIVWLDFPNANLPRKFVTRRFAFSIKDSRYFDILCSGGRLVGLVVDEVDGSGGWLGGGFGTVWLGRGGNWGCTMIGDWCGVVNSDCGKRGGTDCCRCGCGGFGGGLEVSGRAEKVGPANEMLSCSCPSKNPDGSLSQRY